MAAYCFFYALIIWFLNSQIPLSEIAHESNIPVDSREHSYFFSIITCHDCWYGDFLLSKRTPQRWIVRGDIRALYVLPLKELLYFIRC